MTDRDKAIEASFRSYMSLKSQVWKQIAELWQGLFFRVEPHLGDIFKAGADWQAAQTGWVPLADIPDEWKDGRLLIETVAYRLPELGVYETQAMIPTSPPDQDTPE